MPYQLNGQPIALRNEPRVMMDRMYVPLDEVTRALGGSTTWDNEAKVATATIGPLSATLQMADQSVNVNGTQATLVAPAVVEEGVMWVPAQFFQAAFGYQTEVDPAGRQVSIASE